MDHLFLRIAAAGFVSLLLLLGAAPASAGLLIETSCTPQTNTSCKNGDAPLVLPVTIGSVFGTGTYHSDGVGGFSNSGGNFSASFGAPFIVTVGSGSGAFCVLGDLTCSLTVSLIDLGVGGVQGLISYQSNKALINLVLSGTTFTGQPYSSDGQLIGCGEFVNCNIAGVITTPVPEPSSLPLLLAGLALLVARANRVASSPIGSGFKRSFLCKSNTAARRHPRPNSHQSSRGKNLLTTRQT